MYRYFVPVMFVVGCVMNSSSLGAEEPQPTISVSGSAEIRVVPDEVMITASVQSRGRTLAEASKDNDSKIAQVMEFLKTSGVDAKNIHTEYLGIEPIMRDRNRYGKQQMAIQSNVPMPPPRAESDEEELEALLVPAGYNVTRQFRIRITDLSKFETIYRGLIEGGVNQVRGIQFNSSELRKHKDEARLQAVRAAREKATAMAGELGATIIAVKSIDESNPSRMSSMNFMQNSISEPFGDSGDGSFAAGQIQITANVAVVFYLGKAKFDE
jgi:uncharacterized protein YggE